MQYVSGTCRLITGSKTVRGYDTLWSDSNNVQSGDLFKRSGSSYPTWYQIDTVDGNTTFTLADAYSGASADNIEYIVSRDFTPGYSLVELAYQDKDWPTIFTRNMRTIDAALLGYSPPYTGITWKQPVNTTADLPSEDNQDGDARIILSSKHLKIWDDTNATWEEMPVAEHNHNELYYTETEIDAKFNTSTGHDHDGSDSKKVLYSNLDSIPSTFSPANHNLTGSSHVLSGLTTGHFYKATGVGSAAFQAHGLTAGDVGAATSGHTHAQLHTQNTDTHTTSDDFAVGDNTTGSNKTITARDGRANLRRLRYNETSQKWEFSNDGTTYSEMSATSSIGNSDTVNNKYANEFVWNSPTYDDTQIIQPVVAGVVAQQLKAKAGDDADIQRIYDNTGATAAYYDKDGNLNLKAGKTLDGVDLSVHYNATGSEHGINTLLSNQKIEHDSADVGTPNAHGKLLTLDTTGKFPSSAIAQESIEFNILLNTFRDVNALVSSYRNIINGFVDDFADTTGINTSKSSNYTQSSSKIYPASGYLTNYESGGNDNAGIGSDMGPNFPRRGQSFQITSQALISSFSIYLKYVSGTPQDLIFDLTEDSGGLPGAVLASGTISSFTTDYYTWQTATLDSIITCSASTTYHLVVRMSNEAGNAVYQWYRTDPGGYSSGSASYYDGSWHLSGGGTVDGYFRVPKIMTVVTKTLKSNIVPTDMSVILVDQYRDTTNLSLLTVFGTRDGGKHWCTFSNATWGCTYDSTYTVFADKGKLTNCDTEKQIGVKLLCKQSTYNLHGLGVIWK